MKWLWGTLLAVALAAAGLWTLGWLNRAGPHAYAVASADDIAKAKAYLDEALLPMPDGWEWGLFEPEEGVALRVGRVRVPNAKGTVVVVPGYTAPLDLYAATVRRFAAEGWNVSGIEYRGQGLSKRDLADPERGFVRSWARLGEDLAAFVADERQRNGGKLFVWANSMGAHVTLRAERDANLAVDGYVMSVPMVRIDTGAVPYGVARAITTFYSLTGMDEEYAVGQVPWQPSRIRYDEPTPCSTNPATAWRRDALFVLNPALRTSGTTNGWVRRTMASTDELMRPAFAAKVEEPVLMFTAGQEAFVDSDAAGALCDRLGSCERVHFEASSHCLADENPDVEREILDRSVAFMNAN